MKPSADSPDRSFSSSSSSFLTTRSDGTSPGTEKRRIAHRGTGTTTEIAKDLDAKKKAMTGPLATWLNGSSMTGTSPTKNKSSPVKASPMKSSPVAKRSTPPPPSSAATSATSGMWLQKPASSSSTANTAGRSLLQQQLMRAAPIRLVKNARLEMPQSKAQQPHSSKQFQQSSSSNRDYQFSAKLKRYDQNWKRRFEEKDEEDGEMDSFIADDNEVDEEESEANESHSDEDDSEGSESIASTPSKSSSSDQSDGSGDELAVARLRRRGPLPSSSNRAKAIPRKRRKIIESSDEEGGEERRPTTSKPRPKNSSNGLMGTGERRQARRLERSERRKRRSDVKKSKANRIDSDDENGVGKATDESDDDDEQKEMSYDSADSDADERRASKKGRVQNKLETQCVTNINEQSLEELKKTEKFSEKVLLAIAEKRPFKNFDEMSTALSEVPRGSSNLQLYVEYLDSRSMLDRVLDDCRQKSRQIHDELGRMQVDGSHSGLNPTCQLHPYQAKGLHWLVMMSRLGLDAILADEMGLGKTIQVIAFLAWAKENGDNGLQGPHLIVVPSSTIENWRAEIKLWAPKLKLLTYYGTMEERQELRYKASNRHVDLILTTYNMVCSRVEDRAFFKRFQLNYVVYDEGHMLRSCNTQRYRQLMKIGGRRRILLTGTPLQNNLVELISLLYFTMPSMFQKYLGGAGGNIAPLLQIFAHKGRSLNQASGSSNAQPSAQTSRQAQTRSPNKSKGSPRKRGLSQMAQSSNGVDDPNVFGAGEDEGESPPEQREESPLETKPLYEKEKITQAKEILQPFVLRRLKSQVLGDCLPKKHERVVLCDPIPEQDQIYAELLDEIRAETDTNGGGGGAAVGWLMRMRQAANHPLLQRRHYNEEMLTEMARILCAKERQYKGKNKTHVAEDLSFESDIALHQLCLKFPSLDAFKLENELALHSGKCHQLDRMLPKIFRQKEKLLIFSQFTSMLDILEVYMQRRHNRYFRLDGSTPVLERQKLINKFNSDPRVRVFLLSTKAGGLGINLTAANHIIIHDIDFNPYNDRQAEDRVHRLGQTKEVYVTRLISRGTIEEPMWALAQKKLELEKDVTETNVAGVDSNSMDELLKGALEGRWTEKKEHTESTETDRYYKLMTSSTQTKNVEVEYTLQTKPEMYQVLFQYHYTCRGRTEATPLMELETYKYGKEYEKGIGGMTSWSAKSSSSWNCAESKPSIVGAATNTSDDNSAAPVCSQPPENTVEPTFEQEELFLKRCRKSATEMVDAEKFCSYRQLLIVPFDEHYPALEGGIQIARVGSNETALNQVWAHFLKCLNNGKDNRACCYASPTTSGYMFKKGCTPLCNGKVLASDLDIHGMNALDCSNHWQTAVLCAIKEGQKEEKAD